MARWETTPRLLDWAFQFELEDVWVFWVGNGAEDPLHYRHEVKERVKDGVLHCHHALAIRVAEVIGTPK